MYKKNIFILLIICLYNQVKSQVVIHIDTLTEYQSIFNNSALDSSLNKNLRHYLFSKKIYLEITESKKEKKNLNTDYQLIEESSSPSDIYVLKYYTLTAKNNIALSAAKTTDSNFVKLINKFEPYNFFSSGKIITCDNGLCYSVIEDEVTFYDLNLNIVKNVNLATENEYTNEAIGLDVYKNRVLFVALDKRLTEKDIFFQRIYSIDVNNHNTIGYVNLYGLQNMSIIGNSLYVECLYNNKIIYLKYSINTN